MSVCAAPTCSHQSFDGSSYYVDVAVDVYIEFTLSESYINTNFNIFKKYFSRL